MPGRNFSREKYRYGFNGKEKDKDVAASDYDFGARIYDGRIGRWLSVDPLQAKYPGFSPYNFVANSPLSCFDPDGRLIIFINGLRFNEGAIDQGRKSPHMFGHGPARTGIYRRDRILQKYWRSGEKGNSFGRKVDIAERFKIRTGDHKDYYLSGSAEWTSQAAQRAEDGKAKAIAFHNMVQAGLIKIEEGETIKIVSHSHGGAHSTGFAKQLMSYKDANGNPLYNIEVMYYITPHQPTQMTHPDGVRGVQYSHPNDAISSADPDWLPNGGSDFGRINNITEFIGNDIMEPSCDPGLEPNPFRIDVPGSDCPPLKQGQVRSTGAAGNRGGHNVQDNDFIFDIPRLDPGGVRYRKDNPFTRKEKSKTTER